MTEYKTEVENQRRKLILESWGKQWNDIYIEYGKMRVTYNDGSIELDGEIVKEPDSLDTQWRHYEISEEAKRHG
jgi:hypothetical protein